MDSAASLGASLGNLIPVYCLRVLPWNLTYQVNLTDPTTVPMATLSGTTPLNCTIPYCSFANGWVVASAYMAPEFFRSLL